MTTPQIDYFNDQTPEGGRMHWVYYLTHTLQILYLIGFVASGILFVNATITHTHFRPGAPNNDLYSERYASLWWTSLFFGALRFIFFLCMTFMFVFRNVMCGRGRYAGCTIFWVCLMVALLATDFVGLIINGHYLATCNDVGAAGNPCNDAAWCCLPAVRVISSNHCPNEMSGSCLPGVVLGKNPTFLGIFSINVIFVTLELYFVLLPLVLWFYAFRPMPLPNVSTTGSDLDETVPMKPTDDIDPTLAPAESALLMPFKNSLVGNSVALVRRPVVPNTPLLAAAANRLIATATGLSSGGEKNTKQP